MLRLGIVDFDSSHCVEFTRRFHHTGVDRDQYVDGAQIVAGCPGRSLMAPERIPGFQTELAAMNIPLVLEPEDLIGQIDAVLILSLCGAAHLERVRPFIESNIPAFVDKPFASSFADAEVMVRLAAEYGSFLMSCSGTRFAEEVARFCQSLPAGKVLGAIVWGPGKRAEGNPGLFHYGIHSVEMLMQLLGPGCESVACTHLELSDTATGLWRDGRSGIVRVARSGSTAYGFTAFCEQGVVSKSVSTRFAYRNLCEALVESFETRVPAVPPDAALETVRFMSAALLSEQRNGNPIRLDEVLE